MKKPSMEEISKSKKEKRWSMRGVRYIFTLMSFFGFFTIYAVRVNINVAIVAMVNATAVYDPNDNVETNGTTPGQCKVDTPSFLANDTGYKPTNEGEFIWTPKLQAVIIGAFYYGYCISQIPGGRLAEIFSAKWVFGIGTGITVLLTLLTPLAARWHVGVLIFIRAVEGLSQGITMPAMYSLMGRWIPESEKGFLSTIIIAGISMSSPAVMPLVGFLCQSTDFGGWPSAFYVVGVFGCLWFVLWTMLVSDSPVNHPFITWAEVAYITSNQKINQNVQPPPIPWLKIASSVPFWALLITQIANDWVFYTYVNDLPTFFDTILHINIEMNGFFSSFSYILQTVVACSVGCIGDLLIRKGTTSTKFVRKFCNTVSHIGTAAGLIGVCLAGCDVKLYVVFFTISITIGGFSMCGYMLSHLDLSPEYAGTLVGIANTLSNLSGFLAPLVIGSLTEHSQTLHQWHIVFAINIILMLSTSVIFVLFVTTERQPWADLEPQYSVLDNKDTSSYSIQNGYGSIA